MKNLINEGDINQGIYRSQWDEEIKQTPNGDLLKTDGHYFLHQSLSSPCLDVLEKAEGSRLYAKGGKSYLDFHGNNVHQLGHRNSYIIDRVKRQMDLLPFSPRRFTNSPAIQCAEKLTSLLPSGLNRVLFAPAGTLAVSMALKLARIVTGKYKTVSLWDSFHGASIEAISVGGEAQFRDRLGPLLPGTEHIPPPMGHDGFFKSNDDTIYADYLEYVINKEGEIGAFIIETIRNTDVRIPSKAYWQRVREICTKYGVILILDEIPIAFGRTGKMFAFEHFDIEPDIICLGKGMGGGIFPMAGIVAREEYNVGQNISLGHFTHEKTPLGCEATSATIDYIREFDILDKVTKDEAFFRERLLQLKGKHNFIGDIRGIGLLWAIELVKDGQTGSADCRRAENILYECLRNGLSFKISKGNVIQLSPPLTVEREELSECIGILDVAFGKS